MAWLLRKKDHSRRGRDNMVVEEESGRYTRNIIVFVGKEHGCSGRYGRDSMVVVEERA